MLYLYSRLGTSVSRFGVITSDLRVFGLGPRFVRVLVVVLDICVH